MVSSRPVPNGRRSLRRGNAPSPRRKDDTLGRAGHSRSAAYGTGVRFVTTDRNGDVSFPPCYVPSTPIARIVIGIDDDGSINEFGTGTRARAAIRVVTPTSAAHAKFVHRSATRGRSAGGITAAIGA